MVAMACTGGGGGIEEMVPPEYAVFLVVCALRWLSLEGISASRQGAPCKSTVVLPFSASGAISPQPYAKRKRLNTM